MKKILVLLSLCVLFSLFGTLSNENIAQRNRKLILKNKLLPTDKNFFGLLLVPYIICFFAATGIWPHYPQYMQSSVNEMGQQVFTQSDEYIKKFCRGKFSLLNAHAHRPVFFKGIFFPFVPIEEWSPKTTMTTKLTEETTMKSTPAETKETEVTTLSTITEAETTANTSPATTIPPETTTTTPDTTTAITTTTPDTSVVTFDPNQPITAICNCSQPKLVQKLANISTVNIEKIVNTTPLSTSTASPTQPAHIKIDVKNVISLIDLILSYLNLTRSNQ